MDNPLYEGEAERDTDTWSVDPNPVLPEININVPRKTRGVRVDYRYLNDPFLDEEEAGISEVQEQTYATVPDDECWTLRDAKWSPEWPEWEKAIQAELNQLKKMGTWKLIERPPGVVPVVA